LSKGGVCGSSLPRHFEQPGGYTCGIPSFEGDSKYAILHRLSHLSGSEELTAVAKNSLVDQIDRDSSDDPEAFP